VVGDVAVTGRSGLTNTGKDPRVLARLKVGLTY